MLHKLFEFDQNKTKADYAFCLIFGSIFLHALTRAIFSATIIGVGNFGLFAMGLFSIVLFIIVFHNTRTILISSGLLLVIALYMLFIFLQSPAYYNLHPRIDHFNQVALMITGHVPYEPELGRTLAWAVTLLFGALVAAFVFYKFNFILLATIGVLVFLATWGPGFSRDHTAFLLFLFVFCVFMIRRMNSSASATLMVAPLCAIAIGAVNLSLPTESALFVRRSLNETISDVLEIVSDRMFEVFNPTYFSFQATGFGGAGGQLGGPVTLNNRHVMDVTAPGGLYLAGAVSNTFTGYSWIQTLEEGAVYTHGLASGHFEMLETAAALLRNATLAHYQANFSSLALMNMASGGLVPSPDVRHLNMDHFNTVGVIGGGFFLHNYMPTSSVAINMRRQRTGTIFSPQNAWELSFSPESVDYLPQLTFLPTGDIQAPGLMSRGTGYSFQFANPNTQLHFMEEILRHSESGLYSTFNGDVNWWQRHATFGGQIVGFEDPEHFWFDHRNVMLNDTLEDWFYDNTDLDAQDVWDLWFGGFSPWRDERIPGEIGSFERTDSFGVAQMQALVDIFLHGPANAEHEWISLREFGFIPHESYLIHWLDMFATDVLALYAQQVRENFMDVPEIVPERVHGLTHEIIYGLDNDFDRIMAIRDYLMTTFPYTLDTMHVPRGVCFVDHFLFEGQQGYCTYFASAMAIMARIAGVPSRYVEGFVLPPSRYGVATVAVTNRMAHAWVEIYLEGFGWIIVEATPSYAFLGDPSLLVTTGGPAAGSAFDPNWAQNMGEAWFDWEYYYYMDYWEHQWLYEQGFAAGGFGAPAAGTGTVGEPAAAPLNMRNIAIAALIVLLSGVVVYGFSRYSYMRLALRKLRRKDANQQAVSYFKGILGIVTFNVGPLAEGETPLAYGRENGKRYTFHRGSVTFGELIELYYKAKYSPHTISENERALMEEAYFDMVARLRNANENYKFMYLHYVRRIGAV